jgi:hypothetical protein
VTEVQTGDPPAGGPYKGLASFTEHDAAFFFGRDPEREIIIANLTARRLTLLYGETGVGKTSLLRAGVIPALLARAQESMDETGTPDFIAVAFSSWQDDVVSGLIDSIGKSTRAFTAAALDLSPCPTLTEAIARAAEASHAHLLIILDQFEEYFLYHADEPGPERFAEEFPRAVAEPGLQAGFLLAIREDALAKLDHFKATTPRLFETILRVHHLNSDAARAAITRPVDEYNARLPADGRIVIDPVLADAVVNQVRTGQLVLEEIGRGTLQSARRLMSRRDQIETPYLQLVMARLWDEEQRRGSLTLSARTLDELGGSQAIARTHLDEALSSLTPDERTLAAELFHHLVTPSGSKIAHAAPDLADYVRRSEAEVTALLEKLARPGTRILRALAPSKSEHGPTRYEIFHDVLAPSVLDWRTRQTAEARAEEQRRAARAVARRRLMRIATLIGVIAFIAVVALALLANAQRLRANRYAALSLETANFRPTYATNTIPVNGGVLVNSLAVTAPPRTMITAWCQPAWLCPRFRHVVHGPAAQAVTISSLTNRNLGAGSHVTILSVRRDVGQLLVYRAVSGQGLVSQQTPCRPTGSAIPASQLPDSCP